MPSFLFPKLLSFCLLFFLLCCQTKQKHQFSDKDVFRYNESSDIKTLDPAFAKNQAHIWPCKQLYNTLLELDSDLNIQHSIAKRWTIDSTATIYTFDIRSDVNFYLSDNQESIQLTAEDVLFSLERLRSKTLAAPGSWILASVKPDGLKMIDTFRFQIELKAPNPSFLSLLTMPYASILCKSAFEDLGEAVYFEQPIGSGPFYFKFWEDQVKLVLRRNPIYFEKDSLGVQLPYLESIAIQFLPDKQTAFLEFIKGNLDFISGIDASYKDEILDKSGQLKPAYQDEVNLLKQDYLNTEYLAFLVDESPFPYNNSDFRKAIHFAFDRELMMKNIRNDIGTAGTNGFIPKGLQAFEAETSYFDYNVDSAKFYLERSGYVKKGSPKVKLHTNSSYLDLCEYIQNQVNRIGVDLKVVVHPSATLRQLISKQQVYFFRASWIADYPDAENYLSLFYSKNFAPNGPNYTHFSSTEFDESYENSRQKPFLTQRIEGYRNQQALMMAQSPVIPLYYDEVYLFCSPKIQGFSSNPMNLLQLKAVKKRL
ncbi:MAG: ABC transporter substrate-binding protein [Flavobacteriales bacterium]